MSDTTSPIKFYSVKNEYGQFSNFYPAQIVICGITYPTTEHYFQAQKFVYPGSTSVDLEYSELIRNQDTPNKAAILARQRIRKKRYKWEDQINETIKEYKELGAKLRPDWEAQKDNIMRRAVYHKFASHPQLREILCSTGQRTIIESTKIDSYWADGGDGSGKNMLGIILMETRDLLCNQTIPAIYPQSNWVIRNVLLASAYPGARDEEEHERKMEAIIDSGIDIIIDTMQVEEEQKLRSYHQSLFGRDLAEEEVETTISYGNRIRTVMYIRLPIPDRKVTEDKYVLQTARFVKLMISEGHKIMIHCLGGKGRTGVLVAVILGLLYAIPSDEALKLTNNTYQLRPVLGSHCNKSPQTAAQFRQVARILDNQ